jgi:hypothetical protein
MTSTFKNIEFHTDISKMPFHELRTQFDENIDNLEVVQLNLVKVLNVIEGGLTRFPSGKIYFDDSTTDILTLIDNKIKIIPPFIVMVNLNLWTIFDGQHRIGVCRYLGLKEIPFLIRKDNSHYVAGLI